ncbi:MAG: PhnD/SsuA/transferrin family substrate-binding protein [Actinomycetota bacterium]
MRMFSYLSPGYPATMFEAVAEAIGAELHLETGRSGPDPADDPFADGRADVGWICSTSFVELTSGPDPSVQEVGVAWVPDDVGANGRPVYFSDVLVGSHGDAETLDDLAGSRIGCNDPASLSGFHSLRTELDRRGHDPDGFADLVMTGGHDRSIDRLLVGRLDAAVIDSVVLARRRRELGDPPGLRRIGRLGPWPTQPVVMRSDASADEVVAVRDALLAVNDDPLLTDLLAGAALARLHPTVPDHCDTVRTAMDRLAGSPRPC